MLLLDLVRTSGAVGASRARLMKVRELADCLRRLAPEEVAIGVSFLAGEPRQRRLGVGYAKLAALRGTPTAGEATLTLIDVDGAFERMTAIAGRGAHGERERALAELLSRATADEQAFLVRLLIGELRQGALEGVMADAIARAAELPPAAVRRAAMLSGDLSEVARAALAEGAAGLSRFSLDLFRPIAPMLAHTASDTADVLAKWGRAALEFKLDGARIQVHRAGDDVRVFSRTGNDVTASVPEVVETARALPVREIVLDGEAIALTPAGRPQPFQITMRRFGRRLDVERLRAELPLLPVFFDCLYLDGRALIDQPNSERVAGLGAILAPPHRMTRALAAGVPEIDAFLEQALAAGHEGLVLKAPEASYEAGRRGASWLKLKPAHTLDLVVLAVEWGSGRRSRWLSNLHLGARDPVKNGWAMLGKTFKGMTDEMLAWQTEKLRSLALGQEGHVVHVRPELVVEIAFDGIQVSPHYESGLALRFARVKRYRLDKPAHEADTIDTVRALYARQQGPSPS